MTKNNKFTNLTLSLSAAILVGLAGACSKSDKATAPTAAAQTSEKTASIQPAPAEAMAKLPSLEPETLAILSSNKTARVYDQVYWLTNSSVADVQKAVALIQMLPDFDRDGQRAVAHAAVKYIANTNHFLVSQPLLEGKMDPQILSIFMTDTLKRPDEVRIPILKALAESKEHRMQGEASELLVALTNHSTNEPKQVAN